MLLKRIYARMKRLAFRLQMATLHVRRTPAPQVQKSFVFWVAGGMPLMLDVEAAIAVALRLRGHKIHAVMCDGTAKACVRREVKSSPSVAAWADECRGCRKAFAARLDMFNVERSSIGDYLTPAKLDELKEIAASVKWDDLPTFAYEGTEIGSNIRSSVLRYLKGADYDGDAEILREYAFSGLVTLVAAKEAYRRHRATNLFTSHGIYADWGPALRLALQQGLRVTCWIASYLHARFYLRHPTNYRTLDLHNIDPATWRKQNAPLTDEESHRLNGYLRRRYVEGRSFDVKQFKSYKGSAETLRARFGLSASRKTWGIFAHINWDCVSDFAPMLFDDFNEWIIATLRHLEANRSVDWVLKVHPAEAWDNPATGVQALVTKHFGTLPDHIRVVGYDEDINPLDFYNLIDGAVTVYGTAGLEVSCLGKPVIVAGHAHYAGKGFTRDATSREHYFRLLDSAVDTPPLSDRQRDLALRYAYLYFVQRQIPFSPVENRVGGESSFWSFDVRSRKLLLPQADPYVDFISDRIVDGEEFIMPNDLLPAAQ